MDVGDRSLSRRDFDRVIERAITLDHEGGDRVDLAEARAIAGELGISPSAWEAALREHGTTPVPVSRSATVPALPMPLPVDVSLLVQARTALIALVGIGMGALTGALDPPGDWGLVFGAAALVAGAWVTITGLRRHSLARTLVELAVWWTAVTTGIFAGMLEVHGDPIVFGVTAWLGCAALATLLARWGRRAGRGG